MIRCERLRVKKDSGAICHGAVVSAICLRNMELLPNSGLSYRGNESLREAICALQQNTFE